jgi:hypothetical protein
VEVVGKPEALVAMAAAAIPVEPTGTPDSSGGRIGTQTSNWSHGISPSENGNVSMNQGALRGRHFY